jgi:hypothetical protein
MCIGNMLHSHFQLCYSCDGWSLPGLTDGRAQARHASRGFGLSAWQADERAAWLLTGRWLHD